MFFVSDREGFASRFGRQAFDSRRVFAVSFLSEEEINIFFLSNTRGLSKLISDR